jgi:hypothetical protein
LLAIDATASGLDALWHNPDYPASPLSIARNDERVVFLGQDRDGDWQAWRYELPKLTLRDRTQLAAFAYRNGLASDENDSLPRPR